MTDHNPVVSTREATVGDQRHLSTAYQLLSQAYSTNQSAALTVVDNPRPTSAPPGESISGIPGEPFGPAQQEISSLKRLLCCTFVTNDQYMAFFDLTTHDGIIRGVLIVKASCPALNRCDSFPGDLAYTRLGGEIASTDNDVAA